MNIADRPHLVGELHVHAGTPIVVETEPGSGRASVRLGGLTVHTSMPAEQFADWLALAAKRVRQAGTVRTDRPVTAVPPLGTPERTLHSARLRVAAADATSGPDLDGAA